MVQIESGMLISGAITLFATIIVVVVVAYTGSLRLKSARQLRQYRLLAEHSTDMISRHALDGSYLYVSPASRDLLGYEPEEMIGRDSADFVEAPALFLARNVKYSSEVTHCFCLALDTGASLAYMHSLLIKAKV